MDTSVFLLPMRYCTDTWSYQPQCSTRGAMFCP